MSGRFKAAAKKQIAIKNLQGFNPSGELIDKLLDLVAENDADAMFRMAAIYQRGAEPFAHPGGLNAAVPTLAAVGIALVEI